LYLPGLEGGGSTIYDYSGQGNNGTITGAAWRRTSSRTFWTLRGDGTDDTISFGNPASLQIVGAFTILCWPNPEATIKKDGNIFCKHQGAPNRGWGLTIPSARNGFQVFVSSDGTTVASRDSTDTIDGSEGPIMVAAVFDPSANLDIYMNGELNNGTLTGAIPASVKNTTATARMYSHNVPGAYYKGTCYILRVFNVVLSAEDISHYFSEEAPYLKDI